MKVTISRKAHFNAAHRLFVKSWDEKKNESVFGKCSNQYYHGHNYELIVSVTGKINHDTGYVMDMGELKKIIKNDSTKRILVVILEPKLGRFGKYQLKISGKLYNETGEFDQTIFSKSRNYENFKSITILNKDLLLKDIRELVYVFEESWKKNNFFNEGLITFVDVYIPIQRMQDWSNSLLLLNNLPYMKKINIIGLRGDVGKVSLGFQGTNNTFFNILNEKGYKLKQVNDEFILIKK